MTKYDRIKYVSHNCDLCTSDSCRQLTLTNAPDTKRKPKQQKKTKLKVQSIYFLRYHQNLFNNHSFYIFFIFISFYFCWKTKFPIIYASCNPYFWLTNKMFPLTLHAVAISRDRHHSDGGYRHEGLGWDAQQTPSSTNSSTTVPSMLTQGLAQSRCSWG